LVIYLLCMATIRRYRVLWGGASALPGYSVFYGSSAGALASDLVTFFTAIKSVVPVPITWDIPISGDTLDDSTGTINGGWVDVAGGVVSATAATAYAAGTGAYTQWQTAAIVGGRRLRGRTFLAPLFNGGYDTSGTIAAATLAVLSPAVSALATAGKMVVWHRPTPLAPTSGSSSLVTSGTVPDQVTSLRTRRR
jgi:hypothetical protein